MAEEDAVGADWSALAVLASAMLCWLLYRVRMRQCEALLSEMARALADVRRAAEALQTRRGVIEAATLTSERALAEYNELLNMFKQMQEGDGLGGLAIRHHIEAETVRAQVCMVQGCLLAMSEEVLHVLPGEPCSEDIIQENVMRSLNQQRKSYMNMSEELLTLMETKGVDCMKVFPSEDMVSIRDHTAAYIL